MEAIKNPKFENSKYLSFMKQLNAGVIEIQENQLTTNEEKLREYEVVEEIKEVQRKEREGSVKIDFMKEEDVHKEKEFAEATELFR